MNDIPQLYSLETVEQMRALADPLRLRVVDALAHRAMTATQLGELLGVAPARTHYHVRELERVGLVRLVETREKGGILEKYYRSIAESFTVPSALLRTISPDDSLAALEGFMQMMTSGVLGAFSRTLETGAAQPPAIALGGRHLWLTREEFAQVTGQIEAILAQYDSSRGVAGERETLVAHIAYNVVDQPAAITPASPQSVEPTFVLDGEAHTVSITPASPQSVEPSRSIEPRTPATHTAREASAVAPSVSMEGTNAPPAPRRVRRFAAGYVLYPRTDLEETLARGEMLDISVWGICTFPDDVTADLVERAVVRFRHRGVLNASPQTRDMLKHKENS